MHHRPRHLFALAAVGALLFAACGSDDDAGTVPTTSEAGQPDEGDEGSEPEPDPDPAPGGPGEVDVSLRADAIELTPEDLAALESLAPGTLVGIVAATMATDYHRSLNESVKARAEELGFDAEIFDSREDPNQQLQGIEGFISKGAGAIIVTGLGGETIGPVAAEAAAAGIFVVQVAGRDLTDVGAVTVSVEETDIATAQGRAAGEFAAEVYGDEPIKVVITDYPTIESLVARADMIEESFLEVYPNAQFIPRILGGTAENGVASMETALQAHPDITGVLGINDAGNLGAFQALENAGRTADDVFVFGIDCEDQAVDLIDRGSMYRGCVNTNPVGTGQLAVDVFAKWLTGNTVPGILDVPVFVYTGEG